MTVDKNVMIKNEKLEFLKTNLSNYERKIQEINQNHNKIVNTLKNENIKLQEEIKTLKHYNKIETVTKKKKENYKIDDEINDEHRNKYLFTLML